MNTTPAGILEKLSEIAPDIAFQTIWEHDPHFVWDGDGPDPVEEGYEAYDVEVRATAIVRGKTMDGSTYLGGSYSKPGEHDPDVHGYFPQMIQESIATLMQERLTDRLRDQAVAAYAYMERVLRDRYDHPPRGPRKQDWSPKKP